MIFSELRLLRRSLRAFCTNHPLAIAAFKIGQSYRNELTNKPEEPTEELRHLTSTATCLESLGDAAEPSPDLANWWQEFAQAALRRPPHKWASEGSARIYCRCRTLPLVIRGLGAYDPRVEGHLKTIVRQLNTDGRFAIGEADPSVPKERWYPPNAFHTYWTLEILDRLKQHFPDCSMLPDNNKTMYRRRHVTLLWLRQIVGTQIAFHNSKSADSDTDQLVWALACVLREKGEWAWVQGEQDLLRQALKAIFSTQLETGNWPHFRPLFHYRKVGNAYCYIFESLSCLLRVALLREASFLRAQLMEYCDRLAHLWQFAEATAIPLPSQSAGGSLRGWSSGHRSNSWAESWATASVFSYAQLLRRLVGIWTSESALQGLNVVPAKGSREEAKNELVDRGSTWSKRPVSHDLLCLFVNPVRMCAAGDISLDPDRSPIRKEHACSAILHGPPGTSKTTLVQAVAGALGWKYVEIHASHFVSDGLPNVQKRADEIFERLMELDQAVVLFDEVDELVREREKDKADVFGRFLTTSMLPKLAELWKSQKILYFVATNHVGLFDAAIIRSQRFDAIVFVPPPSFERKKARLAEIIRDVSGRETRVEVLAQDCEKAVELLAAPHSGEEPPSQSPPAAEGSKDLPGELLLAKYILLRWDQLDELAYRLGIRASGGTQPPLVVGVDSLRRALAAIADTKLATVTPYQEYLQGRDFARRDFGKHKVWAVDGEVPPPARHFKKTSDGWWLFGVVEEVHEFQIPGLRIVESGPGQVAVSLDGALNHDALATPSDPEGEARSES
jgi:ATPase family associated with various cellular activities (AAA)